jgi:hypothetical protein
MADQDFILRMVAEVPQHTLDKECTTDCAQNLGEDVGEVVITFDMSNTTNPHGTTLADTMVTNCQMFSFQAPLNNRRQLDHGAIVTVHVSRAVNCDTKGPQFVSQSNQPLCAYL